MKFFLSIFRWLVSVCLIVLLTATSTWQPVETADRVRKFTLNDEFDYFGWTIDAVWKKMEVLSLGPVRHLTVAQQRKVLQDYFLAVVDIQNLEESLENLYADPLSTIEPDDRTILESELEKKSQEIKKLAKLAEAILQDQISQTLDSLGLTAVHQPFPPVLYHVSDLPKNLVISPRHIIQQEKSVSLKSDLSLDEQIRIETAVEDNSDYSALVVPVGGVSTYPPMVIRTGNLPNLIETVAHEWTHNYLIFHPLGWNYSTSPAWRTMNETTASIAGSEISQHVIRTFYSDLLRDFDDQPYTTFEINFPLGSAAQEVPFDFRKEMYETRLRVDELLSQKKIEDAEKYMEARRQIFWENGYRIRKLNQAYFAFYGAYADQPYSAAGADPVGEDVRLLRSRSSSLADFIQTISWLSSYEALHILLHAY